MKRILLYILLTALVFVAPVDRVDVGMLHPVEVVAIYREGSDVVLETDTGDVGKGYNAQSALQNMKDTSKAVIYLDTAHYLMVHLDAQEAIDDLRSELNSGIRICYYNTTLQLEDVAEYLSVHGDLPKLRRWKQGDSVPILTSEKYFRICRKSA